MTNESQKPWFEFRIEQTFALGVDAATLGKLLGDMSSAFYAIARAKLGKEAARPGPRTADEDAIAAIRILRLTPGSVIIEAEPPPAGIQGGLELGLDITAEDVLFDFTLEAQRLVQNRPSEFSRPEIRRHVQSVLRDAGEIGLTSEVVLRPRGTRRPASLGDEGELRIPLPALPSGEIPSVTQRQPRRRRISGHAYMVDVEPGRYRIRLKLPDGRDLTLDADESLAVQLPSVVDRVVEIEAVEELDGDQVSSRLAVEVLLLATSGPGSMQPPKTIDQLAEEQGLAGEIPNYEALASAVWESEQDISDFEEYLRQVRQAAS